MGKDHVDGVELPHCAVYLPFPPFCVSSPVSLLSNVRRSERVEWRQKTKPFFLFFTPLQKKKKSCLSEAFFLLVASPPRGNKVSLDAKENKNSSFLIAQNKRHIGLPSGCASLLANSKCLSHLPTVDEIDTEQDGKKKKK